MIDSRCALAFVAVSTSMMTSVAFLAQQRFVSKSIHSSNPSPLMHSAYGRRSGMFAASLEKGEAETVAGAMKKTSGSKNAMDDNPRKIGLALMLDDGTRKSHSVAQNTAFVSGFFKGIGTESAFASLVTSLFFVYDAMEDAFDFTSDECVKYLDSAEIRRISSLEKDMEYFYGPNWKELVAPSKAAREYVARVKEVALTEPYLLVAHQYTRYLGDLFGGQMMGGMAIRSLGLEGGKGTSFYTFDDIPSTDQFITDWYRKLNELDLTEKQKEDIVNEANFVFDLNIGILEELEGSPIQAMIKLAINSLKSKLGLRS